MDPIRVNYTISPTFVRNGPGPTSLARLGMFKAANDSKSRFIHKHMKMATAGTLEPEALGVEIGVEEWLQPRHWGAPADFSMKRVSERLAVMSTEKGLEEYRRSKRAHQRQARHPEAHGNIRRGDIQPFRQLRVRNPASTAYPSSHSSGFHLRNGRAKQQQQQQPGATSIVRSSKRGEGFAGGEGVLKRPFPRLAESEDAVGSKVGAAALSKWEDRVVRRLCDPKLYTGTAATGHLPTTVDLEGGVGLAISMKPSTDTLYTGTAATEYLPITVVDLEGGVGVLLKDASITVKDHVGAQEVSWRLRLAERL